MKAFFLLAYVVLISLGGIVIYRRSKSELDYVSEKYLPPNHRIKASDLKLPESTWALGFNLRPRSAYVGRYVSGQVRVGSPVKWQSLQDRPFLKLAPGKVAHAWFLRDNEKQWVRTLDAGWSVDLCADDCPVRDATVQALVCTSPNEETCAVIIELMPDQKQRLLDSANKQKLNIVVSAAKLEE